jgi:hypothetical protein
VVEQPPPVAPGGGRSRGPGSSHLLPIVVGVLVGAAGIAVAVVLIRGGGGEGEAARSPATTQAEPVLRIIFPEGFTCAQMAERIGEVNEIAKKKRNVSPRLSPRRYLV